ncbi:MAG: DUF4062 domain-containing protein [Vicinamibacterales bacterium]
MNRVFLSSTFADLASHRGVVQAAIRKLGAVDVSMENFGSREERPLEECMRLVRDESDMFVGVYAHQYGFVPDGYDKSISELEYRAAGDAALPRFVYLVDENHPWLPANIDRGEAAERLLAFKQVLLKRHMCQTFGTEDQLATKVVADLGRHMALHRAQRVGPGLAVQDIGVDSLRGDAPETPDEWNARRNGTYHSHRDIFLTHVIQPSQKPGQQFDVFIYLIRHKSTDLSDVRVAEFFLGPYWENKVFPAVPNGGFVGIKTAAYGTFLCICRVTFIDGSHIFLERYVDFESHRTGTPGV